MKELLEVLLGAKVSYLIAILGPIGEQFSGTLLWMQSNSSWVSSVVAVIVVGLLASWRIDHANKESKKWKEYCRVCNNKYQQTDYELSQLILKLQEKDEDLKRYLDLLGATNPEKESKIKVNIKKYNPEEATLLKMKEDLKEN